MRAPVLGLTKGDDLVGGPRYGRVLGRRITPSRDLLLDGWPPSAVAAEVGFVDQAHLSRHFLRHVGTTPGRFARGLNARGG